MPLRVNGSTISWSAATSIVIGIFWLASLSFQVSANNDKLERKSNDAERLARIEVTIENNEEKIDDIKEEQKSQDKKLDRILEKLYED